jgi:hypothetical protein
VDNEELAKLYSLPDAVTFIELRRIRWAGYVDLIKIGRDTWAVFICLSMETNYSFS